MSDDSKPRRMTGVLLLVVAAVGLWLAYVMGYLDSLLQPDAQPASVWVEPVGQPSAGSTAPEVVEPAAPSTPATSPATTATTIPETLEDAVGDVEALEQAEDRTAAAAEAEVALAASAGREAQEQAWAEQQVVPAVRDQAMQLILGMVERHTDSWPWIVSALNRGDLMFFETLPEPCESNAACVLRSGGAVEKVWFTLDVLRLEPDFFNPIGADGIVLHEIAHLYEGATKDALRDRFAEYYVGCSVRGEQGAELAEELMADAMALAVLQPDAFERHGFGRYGGPFRGCLRDEEEPPPELMEAIYGALFDCATLEGSDHLSRGLGVFIRGAEPWSEYAGEGIRRVCGVELTPEMLYDWQIGAAE